MADLSWMIHGPRVLSIDSIPLLTDGPYRWAKVVTFVVEQGLCIMRASSVDRWIRTPEISSDGVTCRTQAPAMSSCNSQTIEPRRCCFESAETLDLLF